MSDALRAAVVIVIRADDGRLLLIQRARADTFPGYWNPVTGAVDADDAGDLINAARREVREEVGIEVELLGKLWESTTRGAPFVLHWFLTRPLDPPDSLHFVLEEGEVDAVRWATLDEVRALDLTFDDSRVFFHQRYEHALARLLARRSG